MSDRIEHGRIMMDPQFGKPPLGSEQAGAGVCHEFIDTGRCEHSDAEHDALADRSEPPAGTTEVETVLARVLEAEGGGPGNSLHSWRCEYPDRYGPCDCVKQVAHELAAALAPWVAQQRAEALREAREGVARALVELSDAVDPFADVFTQIFNLIQMQTSLRELAARLARADRIVPTTERTGR